MNQDVYKAIGMILKAKQMEFQALTVFLPEAVRAHGKVIGREFVQMGAELAETMLSAAVQAEKYAKTPEEPEKSTSENDKNKAQSKDRKKGVSKILVE